ncbi:MAG: hypothetical protein WC333_01050 [Dehalococcoidia bacterium]|jgi:hypothetical protein
MESKILVIYVGVAGVRSEDVEGTVNKIVKKIIPQTFQGEVIIIPVQSPHTRMECINPEYITDEELVRKHTEMMEKLQKELQNQLEQLKESKKDEQTESGN